MTGSRCLQCGAQLPVLRKLTGGGDFCSDSHRQTYQEELNRIALSRLMNSRPREEKPAVPAKGHEMSRSAPPPAAEPAEPPVPAAAGFIRTNLEGCSGSGRLAHTMEPLPASETVLYPECLVRDLDDFEAPGEMALEPALIPPPAGRISVATSLEMCLTEPGMRCNPAPVEFGELEIDLSGLSEAVLQTSGFHCDTDEPTEEPAPPLATIPRKIAIRALEPVQPGIVQTFEPSAFAPCEPQLPTLNILPLRSAITFAPPPAPIRKKEAVAVLPKAAPIAPNAPPVAKPLPSTQAPAVIARQDPAPISALTLGLPNSDMGSPVFRFWYSTPAKVKVVIAAGLLGIVIFSALSKNAGKPRVSPTAGLAVTAPLGGFTGGNIAMGGSGWVTDWAGDAGGSKRGKQLTLYKPSMSLKDYRTEFVGQIETKSLGWVFRAKDTKNYYGMKIRIVRPGVEPGIMLTRYAVVDGLEGPHVDVPLDLTVRTDTLYKVRVEIQGATFSTHIQGKVVDIWSDDRLKSGGFGFSNERGERAHIRSVSVSF